MRRSFFRSVNAPEQARFRLTPALTEGLMRLGLGDDPVVNSFFKGELSDYIKTQGGRAHVQRLTSDRELLDHYLQVLRLPDAVELMMEFLRTREGIDCFLGVCETREGIRLLNNVGQTEEGRDVGFRMVRSPSCWLAIIRIIKGIRDANPITDEGQETLPYADLSQYRDSLDGVRRLASLIRSPSMSEAVFISLSASKEDAELCKRVIDDREGRSAMFGYITADPDRTVSMFTRMFRCRERRDIMSGIFASRGGTRLLVELAQDSVGRGILNELVVNANGMNVGWKALVKGSLRHPALMIEVGMAYFKKPVERKIEIKSQ